MNPQRLVIGGLALAAVVIAAILFVVPQFRATPRLSGYVEGEPLYLASPIAGQLTQVMVARGQRVAAGAPLFVVDTRTLAAARDQAAGRVTQAQSAIEVVAPAGDATDVGPYAATLSRIPGVVRVDAATGSYAKGQQVSAPTPESQQYLAPKGGAVKLRASS